MNSIPFYQTVVSYFVTVPLLELIAVGTSLLYVVLAARGNVWCWPAAFISTALYTVIFYDYYLLMDSLLQVYYLLMAVYGWFSWRNSTANKNKMINNDRNVNIQADSYVNNDITSVFTVQAWPLVVHIKSIILLVITSIIIGWLMANYTNAHFAYIDATTTVFSVFATYLITKKVLENWLYWIVIDLISIYVYIEKGLMPTAILFAFYSVIAVFGYFAWRNKSLDKPTVKVMSKLSTVE